MVDCDTNIRTVKMPDINEELLGIFDGFACGVEDVVWAGALESLGLLGVLVLLRGMQAALPGPFGREELG